MPLAGAVAAATLVQASTSFSLARVMSVAAQRAITTMRKRVQAHVMRLPVTYFDSTKTGVLISRVMSDAEGVRNLVGTGVVHLTGGSRHRHARPRCVAVAQLAADSRYPGTHGGRSLRRHDHWRLRVCGPLFREAQRDPRGGHRTAGRVGRAASGWSRRIRRSGASDLVFAREECIGCSATWHRPSLASRSRRRSPH